MAPLAEPYSPPALLGRFHRAGVAVTTASDAHHLAQVAFRADDLRDMVLAAGYTTVLALDGRTPREVPV